MKLALDAPDLSGAELEESGRFGLGSVAVENGLHHLENVALALTHLHTGPVLYLDHVSPPPERGGHFYRVNTGHF